jgi:hypothetical protein
LTPVPLSVLDNVRIASPCPARWEDMKGDERVRHCEQCNMNVFNLSAMTRAEAEAVVMNAQGRLCAGFWRRADGTMMTRDCPVGVAAWRARAARVVTRVAAAFAFLVTGGVLLGAKARSEDSRLRGMEPFATIARWLDPTATSSQRQIMTLGDLDLAPTAMPAPGTNAGNAP